jgi:hypothetical protein
MSENIIMPKLGMTMKEGTVEEWFKSEGDTVEETKLWHNNIFTHCDTPPYALAFFKSSINSDATSNTLSAFGIYAASKFDANGTGVSGAVTFLIGPSRIKIQC